MKGQDSRIKVGSNADLDVIWSLSSIVESLRAGASVEETIEEGDNEDEADVEAYDREEVDEEEEEEGEEDDDEDEEESLQVDPTDKAVVSDYDVMLVPSPSMQMYSIIGVMLLSRKLDMFNPTVVRAGRFLYIAYVVILQIFLLYVRFQAKSINNRTPIQMSSPFAKILESTQNSQVKNLASSLLSSQSTVLEYDLAQVKSMNGGLLMNMAFLWFLHFKMGQTQPLFLQTVQGLMNLYYSPLFQVYMLGRNLERPFKNPATTMPSSSLSNDDDVTSETSALGAIDEEDEDGEEDDDADVNETDNEDDDADAASDEDENDEIDDNADQDDTIEESMEEAAPEEASATLETLEAVAAA